MSVIYMNTFILKQQIYHYFIPYFYNWSCDYNWFF